MPYLPVVAALALQLGLAAGANLLVARWRAAGAFLLAGSALVPWAIPEDNVGGRSIATLAEAVWALKVIDQARAPRPLAEAMLHLVAVVDLRRARPVPPGLWLSGVAWGVAAFFVASAAHAVMSGTEALSVQLLAALVFAYAVADVVDRGVRSAFRLGGLEVEAVQRDPALALTVTEFWGRRWNGLVHRWLYDTCFRPLARRGHARLGVVAAFVASAALHAYIALPPLGPWGAAWMGAYFALQGALVLAERGLGVASWPWARAWTVTVLVATSPLFTWPVLVALGIRPPPGG